MALSALLLLFACFTTIWAKHEFYQGYSLYEVSVSSEEQVKLLQQLEASLGVEVWSRALPGRAGSVLVPPHQRELFLSVAGDAGLSYTTLALDVAEYSLYEASVGSEEHVKLMQQLEASLGVEVWSRALPGRVCGVLVPPNQRELFLVAAGDAGLSYTNLVLNVAELLEEEDRWIAEARNRSSPLPLRLGGSFNQYHRYADVDRYLVELAAQYSHVQVVTGGRSFEGRDIKYLRISTTNFQDVSKPVIVIESLVHAREWITLPATLYAIHKLVVDVSEPDLLAIADWIILPIVNPDGYEYSHTTQRLLRKNRSTGHSILPFCNGVDLNRNFDFFWGTDSSSSSCSETFHGASAFSESETAVVRDILAEYGHRVGLFVDVHSFGSYILYGYGHTGQLAPNGLEAHLLGVLMAQAIDRVKLPENIDYIVGNSALTLYSASGLASDYAQDRGVPFSYTYELPQFNRGAFVVAPQFIEQAATETWEGLKVGARYVANTWRRRQSSP